MVSRLYPDGAYGRYILPNFDKDLNSYENRFVCIQKHNFYVITVVYVISSITPYKINKFWSKFNFISSIIDIYVLHTMYGKYNYLTDSKLQTSCFYHNYFKNYQLLNMITPKKW